MGAIFDVPRMELSGIQVFAPADISMHQDVALLATACTNLQTCFKLYPKPIARTIDSQTAIAWNNIRATFLAHTAHGSLIQRTAHLLPTKLIQSTPDYTTAEIY